MIAMQMLSEKKMLEVVNCPLVSIDYQSFTTVSQHASIYLPLSTQSIRSGTKKLRALLIRRRTNIDTPTQRCRRKWVTSTTNSVLVRVKRAGLAGWDCIRVNRDAGDLPLPGHAIVG